MRRSRMICLIIRALGNGRIDGVARELGREAESQMHPPLDRSARRTTVASDAGSRISVMTTREKVHKLVDALPESELEPVAEILASRGPNGTAEETSTLIPHEGAQEGTLPAGGPSLRKDRQAGKPGDIIDEWGNLSAMTRASAGGMLQRMDEEELAEFGETIADAWGKREPEVKRGQSGDDRRGSASLPRSGHFAVACVPNPGDTRLSARIPVSASTPLSLRP